MSTVVTVILTGKKGQSPLEFFMEAEGTSALAWRTFLTDQGLATPGESALYRVVVVLKTGNEAGRKPVEVKRAWVTFAAAFNPRSPQVHTCATRGRL